MQNRSVTVIFVLFLGLWGNSASGLGIAQTSQGFALSQQTHDILSAPIPTLTPFPTGDATSKPACSWISHELSFCNSISPGFSTASYTDQRSCLCDRSWSTTIGQFTGAVFDEEVSICADYAFTAQFSDYPKLTSLERFCSRSSQNTGTPTASISVTVPASTVGSTVPTSTAAVPTVGSGAGSSAGPIQNFTPGQIAGISVGGGAAAFLAGFGLYVGIRKKKVPRDTISGQDVRYSMPEQKTAMAEAT